MGTVDRANHLADGLADAGYSTMLPNIRLFLLAWVAVVCAVGGSSGTSATYAQVSDCILARSVCRCTRGLPRTNVPWTSGYFAPSAGGGGVDNIRARRKLPSFVHCQLATAVRIRASMGTLRHRIRVQCALLCSGDNRPFTGPVRGGRRVKRPFCYTNIF